MSTFQFRLLLVAALAVALIYTAAAEAAPDQVPSNAGAASPEQHFLFMPIGAPLKPDQMVRGKCNDRRAYVHGGPGHERMSPHYRDKHRNRARNFKGYPSKPPCWIAPSGTFVHRSDHAIEL